MFSAVRFRETRLGRHRGCPHLSGFGTTVPGTHPSTFPADFLRSRTLPFVDLGHRLEYEWIGPPPGRSPTIVMLHHGLGSLSAWRDFPSELAAETGLGVLAYSRLGYGRSDSVRAAARPVEFMHHEARGDLPKLLDHFGIRKPILVGQSDGASISIIYAGSGTSPAPAALVLIAPHVFVEDCTVESALAAARAYEAGSLREGLARHHDDPDGAFYGWFGTWRSSAFREWNIEEFLPGIRCPILLIQGEDDEYGTTAQLDAIERQGDGPVRRVLLAGAGHSPQRDQPARTLAEIVGYIGALPDR